MDYSNPYSKLILNGLQFVSKFHEITITTSLTAIVLHRIHYSLMKHSGVPLGFLTSAYQLGALNYLVSPQFWGAATAKFRYKNSTWLPLWLLIAVVRVTFNPTSTSLKPSTFRFFLFPFLLSTVWSGQSLSPGHVIDGGHVIDESHASSRTLIEAAMRTPTFYEKQELSKPYMRAQIGRIEIIQQL